MAQADQKTENLIPPRKRHFSWVRHLWNVAESTALGLIFSTSSIRNQVAKNIYEARIHTDERLREQVTAEGTGGAVVDLEKTVTQSGLTFDHSVSIDSSLEDKHTILGKAWNEVKELPGGALAHDAAAEAKNGLTESFMSVQERRQLQNIAKVSELNLAESTAQAIPFWKRMLPSKELLLTKSQSTHAIKLFAGVTAISCGAMYLFDRLAHRSGKEQSR